MDALRTVMSKKKRRFVADGFNLDLTYITKRIIAMGYPSTGSEGLTSVNSLLRNPLSEVQRFFRMKHNGGFKIYNLCKEAVYPDSYFPNGQVCHKFGFQDHDPPPLHFLEQFCENADEWLSKDPLNVIAIHCRAGKGRTGLMITTFLLHMNLCNWALQHEKENDFNIFFQRDRNVINDRHTDDLDEFRRIFSLSTAKKATEFYGEKRTLNGKGITIPSQKRFCAYYEEIFMRRLRDFKRIERPLIVTSILFRPVPSVFAGGCDPYVIMTSVVDKILYNSKEKMGQVYHFRSSHESVNFDAVNTVVVGGVKVAVMHANKFGKDEKMFHFWIHSDFLTQTLTSPTSLEAAPGGLWKLKLTKSELDKACKDKNDKVFPKNFSVTITLEELDEQKADPQILDQYESLRRLIRLNSEVSRISRAKAASEAVPQQAPLSSVGETLRRKLSLKPMISRSDDEGQWRVGRHRSSPQSRSQDMSANPTENEEAKTPPVQSPADAALKQSEESPEPRSPQSKLPLGEHRVKLEFGLNSPVPSPVSSVEDSSQPVVEPEDDDDEEEEEDDDDEALNEEQDLSSILNGLRATVEEHRKITQHEIDSFAAQLDHNKKILDALLVTLAQ